LHIGNCGAKIKSAKLHHMNTAKLAPYRGPKGNLQFPYDQDIPFDLIGDVIAALQKEYATKT
jgi:hypothetical protein